MIQVNLLPDELRKIERMRKVKVNVALLIGAVAVAATVIITVILFMVGQRVRAMNEVRRRLRKITPLREESEALIARKLELSKEIDALDGFTAGRLLWGRKLNDISDAMPEWLFLNRISYNAKPPVMLTVKGEAVPGSGSEKVVEFIETLRRSSAFIKAFPQMDYSIESLEQGRKSFEIKCTHAAPPQPEKAKAKK